MYACCRCAFQRHVSFSITAEPREVHGQKLHNNRIIFARNAENRPAAGRLTDRRDGSDRVHSLSARGWSTIRLVRPDIDLRRKQILANSGDFVAGDLTFVQNGHGVVLTSPNGSRFKLKVSDSGEPTAVEM
ncbi:MAG: hypothetical protein K0R28_3492 [Paenibacillus sp.]|jgi:hypothetical protein|nr:hypothetical protein [Paenibacillus sp.]